MSESTITLSFAELYFLLSLVEGGSADKPRARLGLPHGTHEEQLAQSGLSSLALRDLARHSDGDVVLAPEVGAVLAGLCHASTVATVAVRSIDAADVVQLFLGDRQSLAVSQRAFGCFQFDGVDDDATLSDLVTSLALAGGERVVAIAVDGGRTLEFAVLSDRVVITDDDGESTIEVGGLPQLIGKRFGRR